MELQVGKQYIITDVHRTDEFFYLRLELIGKRATYLGGSAGSHPGFLSGKFDVRECDFNDPFFFFYAVKLDEI